MDILNTTNPRFSGILMLIIFVSGVFIIGSFSLNSHAEIAVSPSSYVNTGESVQIVKGQPETVNGKDVNYTTTHTIPITPKMGEKPGTPVVLPEKRTCEKGKWCDKRFMNK